MSLYSSPVNSRANALENAFAYVRGTIYDLENSASGAREAAKQMRTGCDEAVIGHGYKAAGAGRLTPPGGRRSLPMYVDSLAPPCQ